MPSPSSHLAFPLVLLVSIAGCVGEAPDPATGDDSETEDGAPQDLPGNTTTEATTCGGKLYGGACWYAAADGQSCASRCSTRGGYDSRTATLAGASNSFCNAVLDVVGLYPGTSFSQTSCTVLFGCFGSKALWNGVAHQYRCVEGSSPTAALRVDGWQTRRVCACKL